MKKATEFYQHGALLFAKAELWHLRAVLLALLLFAGLATPSKATDFTSNFVVLNSTRYYTNSNGGGPEPGFSGIGNVGSFDRTTGSLTLAAEANTNETGNDEVQAVQLLYRVYLQNSTPAPFTGLPLALTGPASGPGNRNRNWTSTGSAPNLLTATSGPGRYVLEVYFQGNYTFRSGGGGTGVITDPANSGAGNYYTATFDVASNVPMMWTGNVNNDWFTLANWTVNGQPATSLPTSTTDVTIPLISGGNYPTIGAGVAQVRTLHLDGDRGALGARNFLTGGELQVFGDFQDPHGGFGQSGGIFTLAGSSQTFDGGIFRTLRVQGGGTKTLTTRMDILTRLEFVGDGGVISTRTDNSVTYNVDLKVDAVISGESENSYVLGFLRAERDIVTGSLNTFGNIGVDLTATGSTNPGLTLATRLTGYVYNGVPPSKSVKRSFTFTSQNPLNQKFNLAFHYLDTEVNGILEENLVLFRSINAGIPFANLFRTSLDTGTNILTRADIEGTLAATFTLGDQTVPLPVGLTSFAAVAKGSDAVLTWATAQESNNSGFEVQASDNGQTFKRIAFVAAETPNSSSPRTYQYRDAAAAKHGSTRYYRLRQLDLNGRETYYGPQAVSFGPASAALRGYPNPFGSEINLALQTAAAGPATVSVLDALGRQVRAWQPTLASGASNLSLPGLQALPHGLYVVQVRYNDGQVHRLKLVKE